MEHRVFASGPDGKMSLQTVNVGHLGLRGAGCGARYALTLPAGTATAWPPWR